MKKILITGVFSSGKTSLIRAIKNELELINKKVFLYNEVARECPFDLNLNQNNISTSWLVMRQIENEINGNKIDCDFCIYDRGLPDIIAHAGYVLGDSKSDLILYEMLKALGKASLNEFDYIFFSKKSDKFPIENDGVRINDVEFQESLEKIHLDYLNDLPVNFFTLEEKNENRVKQILSTIVPYHSFWQV